MSGDGPSLPREALLDIYAHARAEFPNECCGYIYGVGDEVEVVRCKNRQDQLHALDPETHPRTSANAYNIGGRELLNLVKSFGTDRPVTIIYHSHPRVGAYFSKEDAAAARGAGYPVLYLVVDAQDDHIVEAKLFEGRNDGREWVEVETFEGAKV
jgi:proteasome lid subunit RPN8/RPN11